MSTGNKRATIMGIKEEAVAGELIVPSLPSDFLPLRPGFGLEYTSEELTNDELQSDIGPSKSNKGKEGADGTHEAYLKHSGVEGVEPELGIMYESFMGSKIVNAVELITAVGSTKRIIKVANTVTCYKSQALLIKDGANGYSIRNIKKILNATDLELNFDLAVAPAAGIALGKAVSYLPQASGFKTFSAWMYEGNGFDIIAASNCQVTEIAMELAATAFGTASFTYSGTKFYYNPLRITDANKYIDLEDDDGVHAISIPTGWYKTSMEAASAIEQAINSVTTKNYTCQYNNENGKFKIESSDSVLVSLLWNTGVNTANSVGPTIGYSAVADDTGATSYESDSAQTYAAPVEPSYDVADAIVIKGAELMIGTQENTMCRCATTVSIKASKGVEDVDCICEETGTKEKVAISREFTLEGELIVSKYDVSVFNYLQNNMTIGVMLNAGPKNANNWAAGKCFNFSMPNAVITGFSPTGDQFVLAKVSIKGFVDSNGKDGAINFI